MYEYVNDVHLHVCAMCVQQRYRPTLRRYNIHVLHALHCIASPLASFRFSRLTLASIAFLFSCVIFDSFFIVVVVVIFHRTLLYAAEVSSNEYA